MIYDIHHIIVYFKLKTLRKKKIKSLISWASIYFVYLKRKVIKGIQKALIQLKRLISSASELFDAKSCS